MTHLIILDNGEIVKITHILIPVIWRENGSICWRHNIRTWCNNFGHRLQDRTTFPQGRCTQEDYCGPWKQWNQGELGFDCHRYPSHVSNLFSVFYFLKSDISALSKEVDTPVGKSCILYCIRNIIFTSKFLQQTRNALRLRTNCPLSTV